MIFIPISLKAIKISYGIHMEGIELTILWPAFHASLGLKRTYRQTYREHNNMNCAVRYFYKYVPNLLNMVYALQKKVNNLQIIEIIVAEHLL